VAMFLPKHDHSGGRERLEIARGWSRRIWDTEGFLKRRPAGEPGDRSGPRSKSLEGYLFRIRIISAQGDRGADLRGDVKRFRAWPDNWIERECASSGDFGFIGGTGDGAGCGRPLVAASLKTAGKKYAAMTDPSVIYGLELNGRWRGVITRAT